MVANLILKGNNYYCSNYMVKQFGIPSQCNFCGYQFSNWEEIAYKAVMLEVEEEMKKNEDYIRRRN